MRSPIAYSAGPSPVDEPLHAHQVVDLDVAASLEPDRLEPEVVAVRLAPDRDEQVRALEQRPVLERRDDRAVDPRDALELAGDAHVDPELLERRRQLARRERLLAGKQPGRRLDDRDGAADRAPRLCHLAADDAAADDDQVLGDLVSDRDLVAGESGDVLEPLDRRHQGARPGREEDRSRGGQLAPVDLDRAGARQPRLAAEQLDSPRLDPGQLRGVVEIVDHLVAAGQQGRHVELAARTPRRRRGRARPRAAARAREAGPWTACRRRTSTRRRPDAARPAPPRARRRRAVPPRPRRRGRLRSRSPRSQPLALRCRWFTLPRSRSHARGRAVRPTPVRASSSSRTGRLRSYCPRSRRSVARSRPRRSPR